MPKESSTRTSNAFAHVEPEIKEQDEKVLVHMKLPMVMGMLTPAGLNEELEKGYASAKAGRHRSLRDVADDMDGDYGI